MQSARRSAAENGARLVRLGETDQAIRALRTETEAYPANQLAWRWLANAHFNCSDFNAAVIAFQRAEAIKKQPWRIRMRYARALLAIDEPAAASQILNDLKSEVDQVAEQAHVIENMLAEIAMTDGRPHDATHHWRCSLSTAPTQPAIAEKLIRALTRNVSRDEAKKIAAEFVNSDMSATLVAVCHRHLADWHLQTNDTERETLHRRELLTMRPTRQNLRALVECLLRLRRPDQAISVIDATNITNGSTLDAVILKASVYARSQQHLLARTTCRQAIALEPSQADQLIELGRVCVRIGEIATAGNFFDRAQQQDPADRSALIAFAQILFDCGFLQETTEICNKLPPTNSVPPGRMRQILAHLRHQVQFIQGNDAEAVKQLNAVAGAPFDELPPWSIRARMTASQPQLLCDALDMGYSRPDMRGYFHLIRADAHFQLGARISLDDISAILEEWDFNDPTYAQITYRLQGALTSTELTKRLEEQRNHWTGAPSWMHVRDQETTAPRDLPVSLICPIHRARDLPNIIHWAKRQSWNNFELVLGINGHEIAPSDIAPELARQAAVDLEIQILDCRTETSVGAALNRCIEQSKGEVVARFDADDIYFPNYVANMVNALVSSGADMVSKKSKFFYFEHSDMLVLYGVAAPEHLAGYWAPGIAGSTTCTWRRVYEHCKYEETARKSEDVLFAHRILSQGFTSYITDPFDHIVMRYQEGHTWRLPDLLIYKSNNRRALVLGGKEMQDCARTDIGQHA